MKKFYAFAAAALVALTASAQEPLYMAGGCESYGEGALPAEWDPADPAEFDFVDGQYTITVKGLQQFKISTAFGDWDTFNAAALTCEYGDEKDVTVELVAGDANIFCPWTGDWTVTVAADLSTITMTTETEKPGDGIQLFLRGDMNGWGSPEEWMFESIDDTVFRLVCGEDMGISVGETFKVADSAWAKYNFGGNGEPVLLELDTELFSGSNDNVTMDEDWNGICWFTLDGNYVVFSNDKEFVPEWAEEAIKNNGVAGIAADNAEAVYYNLQGVRVANPENGMFIVVKGNKTYKTVVK